MSVRVTIERFSGSIPRLEEHLLSKEQASYALDARLDHGGVDAWRDPKRIHTPPEGTRTSFCHSGCWIDFPTCVDVAHSNVTCVEHLFLTGRVAYPERLVGAPDGCEHSFSRLGLPCPMTAPSVAYGGGGAPKDNTGFSFAYQYENAFGERSALSPGSPPRMHPDGSTNVVFGWAVPDPSWGVVSVRIFRTVSAVNPAMAKIASGNIFDTTWMLAATASIGAGSVVVGGYADELVEALEEDRVIPPPEELRGIVWFEEMNVLAGYVGNKVFLSEPHNYHNWPVTLTLDDNVCGICASGGHLYVVTDGTPYIVTPSPGGALDARVRKLAVKMPSAACGNRHIAALPDGVVYPSHDGLAKLSGDATPAIYTTALYAPDDWQSLRPHSVIPCLYGDKLFVFAETGAFAVKAASSGGWQMDFHTELSDKNVITATTNRSGEMFLLKPDGVYQWNRGEELRPFQWHSALFRFPRPTALAALRTVIARGFLDVEVYADRFRVYDDTVLLTDTDLLPMWAIGHDWQIRVRGTCTLSYLSLASSMKEL